jgi:hypothetical protein
MERAPILRQLVAAYREGGVPVAYEKHRQTLRDHRPYRLVFGLIDFVVPLTGMARLLADLEKQIGVTALQQASREVFEALGWPRTVSVAPETTAAVTDGPAVFYANHGGLFTPVLLWAALPRTDVKIITHDLLARCGPNLAGQLFPVTPPPQRSWLKRAAAGPMELATQWAEKHFAPGLSKEEAKAANVASLAAACHHVAAGGGVVIAPDGGVPGARTWFPGLGRLLLQIAAETPQRTVWLVPVKVRNAEWARIFGSISGNPLLRRRARRCRDLPAEVVFGRAQTLEQAINAAGREPAGLAGYLQRDYEGMFGRWGVS